MAKVAALALWLAASHPAAQGEGDKPKARGRLTAADIAVVVNKADPYSVAIGAYYAARRGLTPQQVIEVELPLKAQLDQAEWDAFKKALDAQVGDRVQALALAWTRPYRAVCTGITSAIAMGVDADICNNTCGPTRPSPYFNATTAAPWRDLRMRPAMMLAARDVESAKRLIDRGVAADASLGWIGTKPVHAHFVITSDHARSVRQAIYPKPGKLEVYGVEVHVDRTDTLVDKPRVLLVQTGTSQLRQLYSLEFVDGALADHLTSYGGLLDVENGQSNVLMWIEAGATASYGTVNEPCNHPQKFPHPQLLLLNYLRGETALEAYWKSVAWPSQGVFVGEPLAAPYARR